jgi:flagellar basal-body rod protein FlgB
MTWSVIEKDLQGLSRRLEATSQNIANMNTPTYARKEITFENQLAEVIHAPRRLPLQRNNPRHFSNVKTSVAHVSPAEHRVDYEPYRLDGNNVDPETETARLTESRMSYQAMTRILSRKVSMYRKAIGGN